MSPLLDQSWSCEISAASRKARNMANFMLKIEEKKAIRLSTQHFSIAYVSEVMRRSNRESLEAGVVHKIPAYLTIKTKELVLSGAFFHSEAY
jgi:hypothetical protein